MKLRSLQELEGAVDRETGWRKRELTTVLFDAEAARATKLPTSLRAGVALLYAHWEGWIKRVSEYYVGFVASQRLRYDQLSEPFLALALRGQLKELSESNASLSHQRFVSFLRTEQQTQARFGSVRSIETGSNLSSIELRKIVTSLGLEYAQYELLASLIDRRMLDRRNKIAHGEYLDIDLDEFRSIHFDVVQALTRYTGEVLNSAALRAYRV